MKAITSNFILVAILVAIATIANAQDTLSLKTKCSKRGDVLIDAYWGGPFSTGAYDIMGRLKYNTSHIGIKSEVFIKPRLSIGADFTFAQAQSVAPYLYTRTNSVGGKTTALTQDQRISKYRFLIKLNFHKTWRKADLYTSLGLGPSVTNYKNVLRINDTDSLGDNIYDNTYEPTVKIGVAVRLAVGYKYFVTQNLALNTELGLGGPFAQVGLSYKIGKLNAGFIKKIESREQQKEGRNMQSKQAQNVNRIAQRQKEQIEKAQRRLQDTTIYVKPGDISIDTYWGGPFLLAEGIGATTHHLGLKVDYMANKHLSFGPEISYAYAGANNIMISKLRVLGRINAHVTIKKFDMYGTIGGGLRWVKTNYVNTGYTTGLEEVDYPLFIAWRMSIGARYFVSKRVAINMETGIGGPLVQAGISFKLNKK